MTELHVAIKDAKESAEALRGRLATVLCPHPRGEQAKDESPSVVPLAGSIFSCVDDIRELTAELRQLKTEIEL
jgi:hypothetical protein